MGWRGGIRGGADFRNEDRIRLVKETIKGAFINKGGGRGLHGYKFGFALYALYILYILNLKENYCEILGNKE